MDDILREAHLENPAEYAADGIHPTPDGAMLIGEAYLRAVAPLIEACVADGERD
jgi:lysophospholipase L1-like esterase